MLSGLAFALLLVQSQPTTCLMFESENLAKGPGNWYTYYRIADNDVTIQPGDVLSYSVFLNSHNPTPKGGLDVDFADGNDSLRDVGINDQNGIEAHGDGLLFAASGKWYERHIPLDKVAGRTTSSWNVDFEGDDPGKYVEFLSDIEVDHKDGSKTIIYDGGEPKRSDLLQNSGYTLNPICMAVDLAAVQGGPALDAFISKEESHEMKLAALRQVLRDAQTVQPFVAGDQEVMAHVSKAESLVTNALHDDPSDAEVKSTVAAANAELAYAEPVLKTNVANLVGYAHIDFQWLWNWQEAIVASHDTFRQAVAFMSEFPDFKFSQSSSGLYKSIQESYPDLFAKIKAKVASGQLEILGGRMCEADTNVIGPESHARQFLYAQRYFRDNLGKTATVGWEPDTFGHTFQMPQILKLGGCSCYFFCRAGKGEPLFWWQGLDGTKILSFDDSAAGSWYTSDLTEGQFNQMSEFEKKTGLKDMLYVYGVGNHGGGPTREQIEEAERWKKTPALPKVRFSTAREFFDSVEKQNLSKLPVINQDLNTVFDGCYTTHCEIKKAMRQAETWTSTAEAISAVASLGGIAYPTAELRKNWEQICMNQHHDTMGGSGVHQPYDKTKMELASVYATDRDIIGHALECLTQTVTPAKDGINVLVFNPSGWARSAWCNTYLVQSGGDALTGDIVAIGPDRGQSTVDVLDSTSHLARFWAADVPAFGYKVFHLRNAASAISGPLGFSVAVRDNGYTMENGSLAVQFDRSSGDISRLVDKTDGRTIEASGLGRLEAHYEEPNDMSAWTIGKIDHVDNLKPVRSGARQGADYAEVWFDYTMPSVNNEAHPTTFRQVFRLEANSKMVESTVTCDWNEIGSSKSLDPMVRVAFDSGLSSPTATYEVPFGAIQRPLDGNEYPGQKWGDLTAGDFGVSVLDDAMYGFSASDSTMRISLIRSSYNPDPNPNPGHHEWHYAIYPHGGDWKQAGTVKLAAEFNQPMVDATVPQEASGSAPLAWSLASFSDPSIVATALKCAEDGSGLIVRAYESSGAPSSGTLAINAPFRTADWVNFVEDPLGKASSSSATVAWPAHPFEIKTLNLKSGSGKALP